MELRVLAVGDVVGDGGLQCLEKHLRSLKKLYRADFCVVNGENASGTGLTPRQADRMLDAGADVITLGNHTWGRMQIADYLDEVAKALVHITRPSFDHINNNHEGFRVDQLEDLKRVNDQVSRIYLHINEMLRTSHFEELDEILRMRDELFDTLAAAIKSQIKRVKAKASTTRSSILYLTIINETKTMVLQSRNLLKAQKYFVMKK